MKSKRIPVDWQTWAPFLAVGLLGLALMFFFSDPASEWMTKLIFGENSQGATVAQISQLNGQAKRIVNGIEEKASERTALQDGDRLEVSEGSLVLLLKSQDEIQVSAPASLTFQLWSPMDPQSPLYLTVLSGKLKLLKAGVRGRAYMVSDGKLYLPGQVPSEKRAQLTLNREEVNLEVMENQLEIEPEIAEVTESEETPSGPEPQTLANEYIDEVIGRRQLQLQKCWLSQVRENPNSKGKIIVQFEISRRGKVKDVKITESEISGSTLQNCVITVFERMTFRPYKGAEISLSYPLNFE